MCKILLQCAQSPPYPDSHTHPRLLHQLDGLLQLPQPRIDWQHGLHHGYLYLTSCVTLDNDIILTSTPLMLLTFAILPTLLVSTSPSPPPPPKPPPPTPLPLVSTLVILLSSIGEITCLGDCLNKLLWRAQPPLPLPCESHHSLDLATSHSVILRSFSCAFHSRGERE